MQRSRHFQTAGVYDVKNLKLKLHPGVESKYNSPWNIAADFTVDMSFSIQGIAAMLSEYEKDYHTGMNVQENAELLYCYTKGIHIWSLIFVRKSMRRLQEARNSRTKQRPGPGMGS